MHYTRLRLNSTSTHRHTTASTTHNQQPAQHPLHAQNGGLAASVTRRPACTNAGLRSSTSWGHLLRGSVASNSDLHDSYTWERRMQGQWHTDAGER